MDNKIEILLGSQKNINSINVDNYDVVELTNTESELTEFTVNDVVDSTEQFNVEREDNPVYRIYGRIEFMSLLNGLIFNYSELADFFNPQNVGQYKSIFNSFDFYLVAPSSEAEYTILSGDNYKRYFDIIGDKIDFEVYNAGFSNNVYGEQTYAFSFNTDYDVSKLFDNFGLPITELFLYAQYKNAGTTNESMKYTTWNSTVTPSKTTLNTTNQTVGENLKTNAGTYIYDVIKYNKEEYLEEQGENQKYYIKTPYGSTYLEWSYNPLIPFRLRYLDSVVSTAKLTNIVESGTTLNVYDVNTPTNSLDVRKSLKQNLSEKIRTVNEWDIQTSTYYNWDYSNGILEFINQDTYYVNFKTKIFLSDGTDKYNAETYLELKESGGVWTEIPNTKKVYLVNNITEGIIINRDFNVGDRLRIISRLIPNPNERKLEIIPDFATIIREEGRYVWRDIIPQGYTEPLTGLGVDYPFLNGRRYLFSPITLDVIPNLSNTKTASTFTNISFSDDATTIDITPLTELDDIEKPCQ